MTRKELAKQAFDECCNPETTVKYGVKRGFPFWNVESTMFMYVPAFHFTAIRDCERYRYTAVDELGGVHSFEADDCCVLLTPIWAELPEGLVKLTVTGLNNDGSEYAPVGARTFFKLASFPEETPAAVTTYKESAAKGYRYAMSQDFVQYWLKNGTPDPAYDLNVYPSKMISSLVFAMISYAKICPEDKEIALTVAKKAADYLIDITPKGDVPLADLPPTYSLAFCPDPVKYNIVTPNWHSAEAHMGTMMMFYPSDVAEMYLALEKATGDKKYFDAAMKIGEYYLNTQLENGSWYLVRSTVTGEPLVDNFISPLDNLVPSLMAFYDRTGDERYKVASEKALDYAVSRQLPTYNWEGQFEDSPLSTNYMNLTHEGPIALTKHLATYHKDDPKSLELAKELMRFVEDQFVIWKRPYSFSHRSNVAGEWYDTSIWHTPCGLEQYGWYVPIDASTANIAEGFLALYEAGLGEIYLAKAKALVDQLTVMQHEDGKIPTHWMNTQNAEDNFWFNCMFASLRTLEKMSKYQ